MVDVSECLQLYTVYTPQCSKRDRYDAVNTHIISSGMWTVQRLRCGFMLNCTTHFISPHAVEIYKSILKQSMFILKQKVYFFQIGPNQNYVSYQANTAILLGPPRFFLQNYHSHMKWRCKFVHAKGVVLQSLDSLLVKYILCSKYRFASTNCQKLKVLFESNFFIVKLKKNLWLFIA